MRKILLSVGMGAALAGGGSASAQVRITEWMYSGGGGEFIEFTNIGAAPVDMAGWSYDDDSRLPGEFDLSGFGVVQPGESVVISEDSPAVFRSAWSLPETVKVLGPYTNNLGRADEINLYDGSDALVDRLTYGDVPFPGSIRTQNRSGGPTSLAALGVNDVLQWAFVDTGAGDPFGVGFSTSLNNDTGNPGAFIPEPAGLTIVAAGAAMLLRRRTRTHA